MIEVMLVLVSVIALVLLVEYVRLRSQFYEFTQGISMLNDMMEDVTGDCPHGIHAWMHCPECAREA
jgi:hypothetical protein